MNNTLNTELKYDNITITTNEIPKELSLGISIVGCPIKCDECHSPHLWYNSNITNTSLTLEKLNELIQINKLVSCILFLGGDWDYKYLNSLLKFIKQNYSYKTALYSGYDLQHAQQFINLLYLDYLKVGAFNKELGGLENPNTNQRLYKLEQGKIIDNLTYLFWKKDIV